MAKPLPARLSRREREIMDVVYELGEVGAAEITERMPDGPSYDSVRVTLGILVRKGHLKSRKVGRRNVFRPAVSRERARRSAVRSLLRTFFAGSSSRAILALLDMSGDRLSREELDEIAALIKKERKP